MQQRVLQNRILAGNKSGKRHKKKSIPDQSHIIGTRRSGKDVAHQDSCFWAPYGYGLTDEKGVYSLSVERTYAFDREQAYWLNALKKPLAGVPIPVTSS
jgi:hypothetical protein